MGGWEAAEFFKNVEVGVIVLYLNTILQFDKLVVSGHRSFVDIRKNKY